MSIEIKDNFNSPVFSSKTTDSTKTARQKTPESSTTSTADKVNFTDLAKQLLKVSDKTSTNPPIDTGRIDEIKRAITSGAFEVNPLRIADKLLKLENAMMK